VTSDYRYQRQGESLHLGVGEFRALAHKKYRCWSHLQSLRHRL
jgi:hypothetical protein